MILEDLFTKYGTDKGIWGYTPAYEHWLNERRERVKAVLEIGICGERDIPNNVTGASLFAWRDYFPNAQIVGIDNDSKWMVRGHERIHTFCCDAYSVPSLIGALTEAKQTVGIERYDFICDDAVHDPLPQMNLLASLWGLLEKDGVYSIEDVCPYKVPHDDLSHMIRNFPPDSKTSEYRTHKAERLLIVHR